MYCSGHPELVHTIYYILQYYYITIIIHAFMPVLTLISNNSAHHLVCVHIPRYCLIASSFYHYVSVFHPLTLPFSHTSHSSKTSSLNCLHNFGMPMSTNSITFSQNIFRNITPINKIIFLLSMCPFHWIPTPLLSSTTT